MSPDGNFSSIKAQIHPGRAYVMVGAGPFKRSDIQNLDALVDYLAARGMRLRTRVGPAFDQKIAELAPRDGREHYASDGFRLGTERKWRSYPSLAFIEASTNDPHWSAHGLKVRGLRVRDEMLLRGPSVRAAPAFLLAWGLDVMSDAEDGLDWLVLQARARQVPVIDLKAAYGLGRPEPEA